MTVDAVIVAAGTSSRMAGVDKLLAPLAGRPLLAWSVRAFADAPSVDRIVLVAPPERVEALRAGGWLTPGVRAVAGHGRRQESVAQGVAALADRSDDDVVLVHDGARPVVHGRLVEDVTAATAAHGAALPVVAVPETVKRVSDSLVVETVDRSGLALAQTPQGVRLGLLRAAYRRFDPAAGPEFTDEAALLEACRIPVHAIPGDPANIKVTVPADLLRAERLIGPRRPRAAFGRDEHAFGPGEPLALGGIEFPGAPRLHGHSDGDVVLHAVADALLAAAGLPDLGRVFPADDSTPRGIASTLLVREVVRRLAEAALRPVSVDVTIVGARPRLAGRLDEMRAAIADLLGLDLAAVSLKASTGNLSGAEGAGRGIAAQAIATVDQAP